jgi:uridine monophosphate synthetase
MSVKMKQPMLIRRKEAKGYGTKKLVEGKFDKGETCLIIEDVVTTGSSVLETARDLRSEGLIIEDSIVVVDREQGGADNVANQNIKMHSIFTLKYLLETLKEAEKITEKVANNVKEYLSKTILATVKKEKPKRIIMKFNEREAFAKNEVSRTLFKIMETKKTNLCLAADLIKTEEILNLVEQVGPFICILKTHIDIIENYNEDFIRSLKSLAEKHNFLLMEDRKFADIGNTVSLQYSKGIYKISEWADLVTAHSLPGDGILKGLKSTLNGSQSRGVFLLAEMSCDQNLITSEYKENTMKIAESELEFVAGIVCQSFDLIKDPGLIQLTPGVKLQEGGDDLGQKYDSPDHVIREKGADIAVVGRGICNSKVPAEVAKTYRDQLWEAYLKRTH